MLLHFTETTLVSSFVELSLDPLALTEPPAGQGAVRVKLRVPVDEARFAAARARASMSTMNAAMALASAEVSSGSAGTVEVSHPVRADTAMRATDASVLVNGTWCLMFLPPFQCRILTRLRLRPTRGRRWRGLERGMSKGSGRGICRGVWLPGIMDRSKAVVVPRDLSPRPEPQRCRRRAVSERSWKAT